MVSDEPKVKALSERMRELFDVESSLGNYKRAAPSTFFADEVAALESENARLKQVQSAADTKMKQQKKDMAQLLEERDDLKQELEGWKVCNTCGGAPHPDGKTECICGNTGSAVEELRGLRINAITLTQQLAAERDLREVNETALKWEIASLKEKRREV